MKKTFSIILLISVVFTAWSQDPVLLSKNGHKILPEKGEFALGIDAKPFFGYVGNVFRFGGEQNSAPSFNFLENQTITGKYFLTDKKAIRASLRMGFENQSDYNQLQKNGADIEEYVEDAHKYSSTNIELLAGLEYRRGKGRIQGYYGAEAFLGFSSSKHSYEYGNEFSSNYPMPLSTTNWYSNDAYNVSERPIETKMGRAFAIGAQAIVGVEYFIAPKMALSGEFGWGPTLLLRSSDFTEYEYYDEFFGLKKRTVEQPRGNAFSWNARNANGKIAFFFYF